MLLLLLTLLAPAPTLAQPMGNAMTTQGTRPVDLEGLSADLMSDRGAERAYAARELRRRAMQARRRADRGRGDGLLATEARVELADQRRVVGALAARSLLAHPNLRGKLADILGALRDPRWRPELQQARATTEKKRQLKHIDAALAALEGR